MKWFFLFLMSICFSTISFSQEKDSNEYLTFVNFEVQPLWKSCDVDSLSNAEQRKCSGEKLADFIYSNLRYPSENNCFTGTIIVQFTIEKDGTVSRVKFPREVYEPFKKEIKKVINKMPKWKPGIQRGKPVPVLYTLPIKINLS